MKIGVLSSSFADAARSHLSHLMQLAALNRLQNARRHDPVAVFGGERPSRPLAGGTPAPPRIAATDQTAQREPIINARPDPKPPASPAAGDERPQTISQMRPLTFVAAAKQREQYDDSRARLDLLA